MAYEEGEVVVLPTVDGHVDVGYEVDAVEWEPTNAEDDDHGDAESVVLAPSLLFGLLFGGRSCAGSRTRNAPLRQTGHY